VRALVASEQLRDAIGPVDGVRLEVWDGTGPAPAAEVWVAPYGTGIDVMGRAAEVEGLRLVQLQSAGFDGLLERLPAGITLCNAAGVHDDATAEHALGLTLASLRGIPEAVRAQDAGRWEPMPGRQSLADAHVLVLGYGSIGRALAERLFACRAQVTAVASRQRGDDLLGEVHGPGDLDGLLPRQHVVVVLLPLSDATRHSVDAAFLASMSDGALLVNVARGGVVDPDAVLAEAGRLRFALDVTEPEPLPDGHPLWTAPGVLVTPHVAGGTTAMLPRMATLARDQLLRLRAGEAPEYVVGRIDDR
jgi:phosphoglycerate dehydrogenase-like enzyme